MMDRTQVHLHIIQIYFTMSINQPETSLVTNICITFCQHCHSHNNMQVNVFSSSQFAWLVIMSI